MRQAGFFWPPVVYFGRCINYGDTQQRRYGLVSRGNEIGALMGSKSSSSVCLVSSKSGMERIVCSLLNTSQIFTSYLHMHATMVLSKSSVQQVVVSRSDTLPTIATCVFEACYPFPCLALCRLTITNQSHLLSSGPRTERGQYLKTSCQRTVRDPGSIILTSLRFTEVCDCRMTAIGILASSAPSCFSVGLNSLAQSPRSGTLCQLARYTGNYMSKLTMLVSSMPWPSSPVA